MGFSQGSALSPYTGVQLLPGKGRLGGIVVMSGYLPQSSGFAISPGLEFTPVFHGHGKSDLLVRQTLPRRVATSPSPGGGGAGWIKAGDVPEPGTLGLTREGVGWAQ